MKIVTLITLILFANLSFSQNDDKTVETILQKSIDSERISIFFHGEKVGRDPLIILDNSDVLRKIKLYKFNKPVIILTEKEILEKNIKAYIEFKYILTEKDHVSVSFKYDIEGITADIDFSMKGGKWEIKTIAVVED